MAAVLEIARVLSSVETGSSVELVAFGLEEVGILGSLRYVQRAHYEGREFLGMFSLDMIGYTCHRPGCQGAFSDIPGCLRVSQSGLNVGNFIAAVANEASVDLLRSFEQAAIRYVPTLLVGSGVVAGKGACMVATRLSDHSHFWDRGYAAVLLTDTALYRNPHYHRPTDTLATLDLPFAHRVTQAVLATALSVAGLGSEVPPEPTPAGGGGAPPALPR